MVKKLKAMADKQKNSAGAGLFDNALAASVRDSAEKIWLAGMGAFAKAQAEGKQVFESLVKDGAALQKKTQSVAEEKFGEVSGRMSNMAEGMQNKAGQHWDKLESIFEARTARAMHKLGMPTSKDLHSLSGRIDALSVKIDAQTVAPKAKRAASKTATKKAPAKKASAKRASRKGTAKTA